MSDDLVVGCSSFAAYPEARQEEIERAVILPFPNPLLSTEEILRLRITQLELDNALLERKYMIVKEANRALAASRRPRWRFWR